MACRRRGISTATTSIGQLALSLQCRVLLQLEIGFRGPPPPNWPCVGNFLVACGGTGERRCRAVMRGEGELRAVVARKGSGAATVGAGAIQRQRGEMTGRSHGGVEAAAWGVFFSERREDLRTWASEPGRLGQI